jgi:hypothetical protein
MIILSVRRGKIYETRRVVFDSLRASDGAVILVFDL